MARVTPTATLDQALAISPNCKQLLATLQGVTPKDMNRKTRKFFDKVFTQARTTKEIPRDREEKMNRAFQMDQARNEAEKRAKDLREAASCSFFPPGATDDIMKVAEKRAKDLREAASCSFFPPGATDDIMKVAEKRAKERAKNRRKRKRQKQRKLLASPELTQEPNREVHKKQE
jgi:hypothetical protein